MQRQTEGTLNMSEITFTASGPARKAKNYFLFCFLRKLYCITCGLCPSSLKWGQIKINSIEMIHQVHKSRWSSRPERSCKYPRSGRLPAELTPSRNPTWEGRPEGKHQCHRHGEFDISLGAGLFQAALSLAVLAISETPALFRPHQTASSAAHGVGASIKLGPQIWQAFDPSPGKAALAWHFQAAASSRYVRTG